MDREESKNMWKNVSLYPASKTNEDDGKKERRRTSTTMSSVECLRGFVSERLTAAAEEIFRVFMKTIVQYEEEIDRQRRLLDIVWKPEIKLRRIELPQQHVFTEEEETLSDQQLCNQEKNSSLDQEEPEPPQIKEEQEELWSSQGGGQPALKEETNTFLLTSAFEDNDHSEDRTVYFNEGLTQSAAEPIVSISIKSLVVPEPNTDQHLVSHEAESQDRKGGKTGDSGSSGAAEPKPKKRHHRRRHTNNVCKIQEKTFTDKKSFKCDTCGKDFKEKSKLDRHIRVHTGEKPFFCNTCGKSFSDISILRRHITIHTGVKPYPCKTCGKSFAVKSYLRVHLTTHTGEKPYNCFCGRRYTRISYLKRHIRNHTKETQGTCKHREQELCGD
ncbi:zinc finger protein 239-like [Chelmon rostratus]|uniref:zinc finger protein 239-like n=1 Tax=Chelmon rostratus TaxID=109905 RepID=UPI001BECC398|nr:zinc finger protein 239-like [Chelmon rostratus]